jgi:hypothetical protein
MGRKGVWFFVVAVVVVVAITVIDYVRIIDYPVHPRRPETRISSQQNSLYQILEADSAHIDWRMLDGTFEYINGQYDCSDFRYVNLMRILYRFEDRIPSGVKSKMENTVLGFRYWWDEPGENSMCYWSENHQILFAMAEYLVGQKYPQVIFNNDGQTGAQHMEKARKRILDWLEMRWLYGFTEYNSEVYYQEDIGALINLIDFASDNEIVIKSKIILDLLIYDVSLQNIRKMMVSTSGRAYERSRKGGPQADLGGFTSLLWDDDPDVRSGMLLGMEHTENYQIPEVLKEIAKDTSTVIIKQQNGLNISDLAVEGFGDTDDRSMMMQWGMEAFTNADVIGNSLEHIRRYNMFSNDFISDFRYLDFTLIRLLNLEPILSKALDPQANGVAIQQGNTYTFKTKHYSLYTSQNYHPGSYGDQQHISGMNIGNHFSIFHVHPALEKDVKQQSPNYWVGYGHLPHAVQDRNVSLAIYSIPGKKRMLEKDLLDYTHAYFPTELFDTTVIHANYAFGKKEDIYCALIGRNELNLRAGSRDDLVQEGKSAYWITEAGSRGEDGSFEMFCERILNNPVEFDSEDLLLHYDSKGRQYQVKYKGDFNLNGQVIDTEYKRFDSPYCQAPFKPETVIIEFKGKSLELDFYNQKRAVRN